VRLPVGPGSRRHRHSRIGCPGPQGRCAPCALEFAPATASRYGLARAASRTSGLRVLCRIIGQRPPTVAPTRLLHKRHWWAMVWVQLHPGLRTPMNSRPGSDQPG
jgi:hypothetical protein